MKPNAPLLVCLFLTAVMCSCSTFSSGQDSADKQQEKIKVVVVTGGHDFEPRPFFAMFDAFEDIEYVEADQRDHSEIFEDITNWDYDVIVLYNMTRKISPKRQQNFIALLERRVGLLVLHHAIAAFQDWPEYHRIIGAKYYLNESRQQTPEHDPSGYQHDVDFTVHLSDTQHPVTRGLSDFWVHDEVYNNCHFEPDNSLLLTTDHPASNQALCWVRNYRGARVCCIQPGHGPSLFENPNYRRLVAQALNWCADRSD
ncbi:MAG: ThuA domain-containing protein [Planctomycetota bacterium]